MNETARRLPASMFGIIIGIAGIGIAWRGAARVWGLPAPIGEALLLIATALWLPLLILYGFKWLRFRQAALDEAAHPIQCCFISLIAISTLLIALAAAPYQRGVALTLFVLGATGQFIFGVWRTGGLWRGGRSPADTTAIMYLPLVGGNFTSATVAGALGFAASAQMLFGAGLLAWLALESVILHRLYTQDALPKPLRPTLGIMLAPPSVGAVSYLSVTTGLPDLGAHLLFGYALIVGVILVRLWPWIHEQPFAASYWGFSFGVAALPIAGLRMLERGDGGILAFLVPVVFGLSNLIIATLAIGTLRLLWEGRLLPPSSSAGSTPTPPRGTA